MGDYPDDTTLTQIIGVDVVIPISIDAATVSLDVDIVAQTVGNLAVNLAASAITVNVDVVAQTVGNIAVNLAASAITLDINIKTSAITLNVDITATTIGNLTIDIEAQSVGVYMQPEWASLQGIDKNLFGTKASLASGTNWGVISYTVPAGKTLYVCAFGFACLNVVCSMFGFIWNNTTTTSLAIIGGTQGNGMVFNKVISVPQNNAVHLILNQLSGGVADVSGFMLGYEI